MTARSLRPTRLFASLLVALAAAAVSVSAADRSDERSMDSLVTVEWLNQHLNEPDLVVLDCTVSLQPKEGGGFRSVNGLAGYMEGHIPSAGFADLMGALCDTASDLNYAMPTPQAFCTAMGALGVGDNCRVVLYDTYQSVWAARVWWMLRWVGYDRVALLDGGLRAWKTAGFALSTEAANEPVRTLTPSPRPALIADREEMLAAIDDRTVMIVDVMPPPHYTGKMSMYARPGHIPGAVNESTMSLLDATGRFKSHDELAKLCSGDPDQRVITYCGGGIAASANAFVMVRLGYENVAVYTASLQEWAADPKLPMVVEEP